MKPAASGLRHCVPFLLACSCFSYSYAQFDYPPTQDWIRFYNGFGDVSDEACALALDSYGNVVVTGNTLEDGPGTDCTTVKYGPDGSVLWAESYNGPGNAGDGGRAIAADGYRNVFVAGHSEGIGSYWDCLTIKYGPDGQQIWEARYNGGSTDLLYAIALDGSGNVLATGSASGGIVTLKYSTLGQQLWAVQFDGYANSDVPADIAVDASGNVYVTGRGTKASGLDSDFVTIKYDNEGQQQWVSIYDASSGLERAFSICVEDDGCAVVTGNSNSDIVTVGYDTEDGSTEWIASYDGPASSFDFSRDMVMDGSGSVYVAGFSVGAGTGYDYVVIKYDPTGSEEWVGRYDGPFGAADEPSAIALDGSGNVYVTGSTYAGQYSELYNYATVSYDPAGNQRWEMIYNSGYNTWDEPSAIAVDWLGNVYVTGSSGVYEWDNDDWATIKYRQYTGIESGGDGGFDLLVGANPTGSPVSIVAVLPESSEFSASIYGLDGRLVGVLQEGSLSAGVHELAWDAGGAPSGVYLIRACAGSQERTSRIVLVN